MLKFLTQIIKWIAGTGFSGSLNSGNSYNEDWRSWVDYKKSNPDSTIQDWFTDSYNTTVDKRGVADSVGSYSGSSSSTGLGAFLGALTNRVIGRELTGAEREQNAFNANQAQIDRDFQERMANTQYQRAVTDMRSAGVNPALAISNGGNAAPSGSMATGAGSGAYGSNFSDLMQLLLLKPQRDLMKKQGDAAIMQGQAALKNAGTRVEELDVSKYDAETRRMLANNEILIGDSTIRLNESKMLEIAQQIKESESRIELQDIEKLAKNLDYKFSMEMYETNKALLIQELAFRAVQMSNLNQLTAESAKRIELMTNEQAGTQWMSDHPKLASGLGIASGITGVIGNVLRGSVSAVAGKWSK